MVTQEEKLNRFPKLMLGFFSMLFAGIIYAWSILKSPLVDEFGWNPSELAFNFTLSLCFFCIGGVFASFIIKAIKLRFTVMLAGVLTAAGFILTAANTGSLTSLYFSYGFMCGLGVGMAYNTVISSINAWYPDKKGVSSGVMMMGFGLSTLIFGNIANVLINMDGFGWRNTYIALGIAIGAVLIATSFLISTPGPDTKFPEARKKADNEPGIGRDFTVVEMVKRMSFWKFFVFHMLLVAVGSSVISFAMDLSITVGAGDSLAAFLVGVLAVCNGLGRILTGLIFDSLGRKRTLFLSAVTNITASAVLFLAVSMVSLPVGIIGLCMAGLGYGSNPTMCAGFTMEFYGRQNFNQNFGVMILILIPSSFFATLSNYLLQATGSYQPAFLLLLGTAVAALFINFTIKRP